MMNYNIHIENLGAIKEADITISPLTILAGENGTGKSFVTKFFYSVFNTLSRNVYSMYVGSVSVKIHNTINSLMREEDEFQDEKKFLESFKETIISVILYDQRSFGISSRATDKLIEDISSHLNLYKESILPRLKGGTTKGNTKNRQHSLFNFYYDYESVINETESLLHYLKNPKESYISFLKDEITNQLKENFQIAELRKLIKFNESYCLFVISSIFSIKIFDNNEIEVSLISFPSFANLIFFESPVYWKLLSIIPDEKLGLDLKMYKGIPNESLTGVPRHFLDLKDLLFTNFKDGERPDFIIKCADELESKLQGKFRATNSDLTFENNKGQSISKSLVSFGMTNLGIFQAVLSKNIINKGSFVFIDEPESNLHPEWQAILAKVLVQLAKNNVYVIVTTHSSDMLKAFEISTQEQKASDQLSTYYLQPDGKLLTMDNENLSPIEYARNKLLETYEKLMVRGYLL